MKKILLISLIVFSVVGCTAAGNVGSYLKTAIEEHEVNVRLIVLAIIEGDSKDPKEWGHRAQRLKAEIAELEVFLDFEAVKVVDLREEIYKRIKEKGYSPLTMALIPSLAESIGSQVDLDIESGLITAENKATIQDYFDLGNQVADVYL